MPPNSARRSASSSRLNRSVEAGSSRWLATLRSACSPMGSQGRTLGAVKPAAGEASHGMGVRDRSRTVRAATPALISSRLPPAGMFTSVIAISSP